MKTRLLLILAASLLFARFIHLNQAPFILDEPHLQLILDQNLRAHTLPVSALKGMKDIPYGPTALWFYLPLRLFSASVTAMLAWNALASVVGLVAFYLAARKAAGKRVAAWCAALAASSPYLYMYSRQAWDQPLLVPLVGMTAWIVAGLSDRPLSLGLWSALGVLCGLCFNLHFSTLPVLFGVAVVFVSRPRQTGFGALKPLGTAVAAFSAVTAPYLLKLSPGHGNFTLTFWPEDGLRSLYYSSRFFSWKGMSYFFDPPALHGAFMHALFWIDWSYVLRVAACLVIWVWVRKAWRQKGFAKIHPLWIFGISSWLALLFFYAVARPDLKHPHYFLPVWWVLFFCASWAIVRWPGKLRRALEICGWLTVALNAIFIAVSWSWLAANSGSRTLNYGPSEAELSRTVRSLCAEARALGFAGGKTASVGFSGSNPFPASFQFLSAHAPACAGLTFDFFRIDDAPKEHRDFSIEYTGPGKISAALSVERSF